MADNEVRKDPDNDTVRMGFRCYRESKKHSGEWRKMARDWYDLVANKQWDDDDVEAMKDEERIPVVINRTARAVNAIIGTQVNNRQETRFIPRELGDVQVNEVLTGAADWVRDGCEAEDEESDAFEDTTVCGMGWTETRLSFDEDPEGQILIDRMDPIEMYWDPGAKKRNLADAKWVARVKQMAVDEFNDRWPNAQPIFNADPWYEAPDDLETREHVYPHEAYENEQRSSQASRGRNTIGVMQIQWAERVPMYRVGKAAERVSEKAFEALKDKLDKSGTQYLKQTGIRWKQAFIGAGQLLEEDDCPYPNGPTLRCITYKRDRNKNTWYGIVAAMMDPQKYGNKFLSLIMDILTKSSKGGVMMEKDAVDKPREVEKKWARTDALIWLRPGGVAKVKEKPKVEMPAGMDRLVAYFLDAVHEVTGINLELLGMANREQAGVLEHQRKQAGVTIIAPLFDGLRRYRKEQGRVLLYFIQTYISDGRLIRINGTNPETGKQGEYFAQLRAAKDSETARYDVVVDEAPTSPNMKERTFGMLSEIMPALMKAGVPVPPEILDYAPFPSKLVSSWKEHIQKSSGQMDPEQVAKLQQENQELKLKKDERMAELQMEQQKHQQEMVMEQQKMQLEREKMQIEVEIARIKLELEREKAQSQMQIQQMQAQNDMVLSQQQMQHKQQLASQDFALKKETAGQEMQLARENAAAQNQIKREQMRSQNGNSER